jgi:hypothetical protein
MSCTYNGFTQEVIKANIIVAKDGTLSVKEKLGIILVKIFYYYQTYLSR